MVGFCKFIPMALLRYYLCTNQECREACGGQGYKTENRVGHLKGEFDVQSTFEGDNNVLMQQVRQSILLNLWIDCFPDRNDCALSLLSNIKHIQTSVFLNIDGSMNDLTYDFWLIHLKLYQIIRMSSHSFFLPLCSLNE